MASPASKTKNWEVVAGVVCALHLVYRCASPDMFFPGIMFGVPDGAYPRTLGTAFQTSPINIESVHVNLHKYQRMHGIFMDSHMGFLLKRTIYHFLNHL